MKKFLLAAVLTIAALALGQSSTTLTRETLVLASAATRITVGSNAKAVELQNLGPNPIYCSFNANAGSADGGAVVATKARRIDSGGSWGFNFYGQYVWCIAGTADQVTGAATVSTEAR